MIGASRNYTYLSEQTMDDRFDLTFDEVAQNYWVNDNLTGKCWDCCTSDYEVATAYKLDCEVAA
jgi:hypothetical protein